MNRRLIIVASIVLVTGVSLAGYFIYQNQNKDLMAGMDHSKMSMNDSETTYNLNLMSGKSYLANKTQMLHFNIKDQSGNVLKDFDTVHTKKLHLIVVRKDRTNFQHVHPTFDQPSGMFMIEPFTFPTDGDYRVFADFTPANAGKDDMGMKMASTPYQDVQVGDTAKYTPESLGTDKLTSSVNGLDTMLSQLEGDSMNTGYYANTITNLSVDIEKNGTPFTSLQEYLGALGHMVILGPNLEFIHGHPLTESTSAQTGKIVFQVTFPKAGQYKLYLQTQANDQVNTTDYNLTVKDLPKSNQTNQPSQSMEQMSH